MPNKLQMKRLWKLVEFMKELPPSANKHFSMMDFIDHTGDGHQHQIPMAPKVSDLHACGTTACALGWAMTVPSFRRAGLRFYVEESFVDSSNRWYTVGGEEKVFGLDTCDQEAEWEELFGARNEDKTPKAWAARVAKVLHRWEKAVRA